MTAVASTPPNATASTANASATSAVKPGGKDNELEARKKQAEAEEQAKKKAEADKLAENADFVRRLAYLRDKALMEGVLTKVARESNNDAAVREVYAEASKAQAEQVRSIAVERIGLQYDLRNVLDLARYLFPTPPVPQRFRRRMIALGSEEAFVED